MKKHILIAEDDPHIRLGVVEALESENYRVTTTENGSQVLPLVKQVNPDLLILDIMLPGKNGFDICRDVRKANIPIPVLILTAKGQEVDKVVGLELGADDYVTKPFGIRELLARIHALLRRSAGNSSPANFTLPKKIRFGDVDIDTASLRGSSEKRKFELSPREMKVLALLHQNAGNVVERNRILDEVWGVDYYGTTRTLDQVIVKIRQKVEKDPSDPVYLITVHGMGYRLEVPSDK